MEKVKTIALTETDFQEIFIYLGLPYEDEEESSDSSIPINYIASPLIEECSERQINLDKFSPSPYSPSTYHKNPSPRKKDLNKLARKPGRPRGSKTKQFVSRWNLLNSFNDVDDDISESEALNKTADDFYLSEEEQGSTPNSSALNLNDGDDCYPQVQEGRKGSTRLRQRLSDTIHFQIRKQRAYDEQNNYNVKQEDLYSYSLIKGTIYLKFYRDKVGFCIFS